MQTTKRQKQMQALLGYLFLSVGAIAMVVPFIWMISTSLKGEGEVFIYPPRWIPVPPQWSNYPRVFEVVPFPLFSFNSLKIALLATFGTLLSCSMTAYAFARLRFPFKEAIYVLVLATLMVPGQVTMIPVFLINRWLGWIDTHLPLIVPHFMAGAFGVFLLRQFFTTLPNELSEAAKVDGASDWTIYSRIILPLSKPALATLGVFTFMGEWNNLLGPVIYLTSPAKMTLSVGLTYFRDQYSTTWTLLMAGALLSVLPILALFAVAQKYFVQGVVMTGLKG